MWQKEALLIELKKRAIYPTDFWLKMLVPPLVQLAVAYFLWDAIYASGGADTIGGYTFAQMMLYYLVAASLYQLVQPEIGIVIRDIYEGTLTKYLFYPLSFFQFKFIAHGAHMLLMLVQFSLLAVVFTLLFGYGLPLSASTVCGGIAAAFIAGYLYFVCAAVLELFGFWVEQVWGLVIMLQFVTHLLGGKLIPLSVFPHWAQELVFWTPFPWMISFPTRVFLGEIGIGDFCVGVLVSSVWCVGLTILAGAIWRRGSYQFTGTGM